MSLLLSFGFIELTDSVVKHLIFVRARPGRSQFRPVVKSSACFSFSPFFFSSLPLSLFSQATNPWLTHALAAGFLMFTAVVDAKIGQAYCAPPTRKRKKRLAAKTWGRLGTLQTVCRLLRSFSLSSYEWEPCVCIFLAVSSSCFAI